MHLEEYDYLSGTDIGPAERLDFGNVIAGQHSTHPVVFRISADISDATSMHGLRLYQASKDTWTDAVFSYYTNPSFTPIESSDPRMMPFDSTGVSLGWDGTNSDFVWIDVDLPPDQTGLAEPTFRITFET